MKSQDYRAIVKTIARSSISRKAPGLKKQVTDEIALEIARAVHARMYGANVDGVSSPIWRDHPWTTNEEERQQPTKTAQELLDE